MSYTSIVITKYANNVFFAKDNTLPGGVPGHYVSGWSGGVNNDLFTIKSHTGGIVYNNQLWSKYSYVDDTNAANNFTPTSAIDLVTKLTVRGFFEFSSGGGGSVPTIQELANSLFSSLVGRGGQVLIIDNGEAGFTTATPSFAFQNNIGKAQGFVKSGSMWINTIGMANYVNDNITINVTETNAPVVIRVQNTQNGVTTNYLYFFFGGKGVWGDGGTPTTQSHFYYITERNLTVNEVAETPNSETFDLGDTTGQDFWEVANLQDPPYDLADSGDLDVDGNPRTYFFSFTDDSVLYIAKFQGAQGYYGVGELQFVEGDFVTITNNTVSAIPNIHQTLTAGNQTTLSTRYKDTGGRETQIGPEGLKRVFGANATNVKFTDPTQVNEQYFPNKSGGFAVTFVYPDDFEGTDTEKIQAACDFASESENKAVLITTKEDGDNVWMIDNAILLDSNTAIWIVFAKLKLSDICRDNMFRTSNCGYGITDPKSDPRENITIIGMGSAILEGADVPRSTGDANRTLSVDTAGGSGLSYGSDALVPSEKQTGDWRNNMVIFSYTNNVQIKGVQIKNPHCFSVCFERCTLFGADLIHLDCPGYQMINGNLERTANRDGVKIIQGGHDGYFTNISGHTEDNTVTAALLGEGYSTNAAGTYDSSAVCGQIYDPETDDIYNIYWNNIQAWSYNSLCRILNTNGSRIYNFTISNVKDTSKAEDLEREITGGAIIFGSFSSLYGGLTPMGSCSNFNIENIYMKNSRYGIQLQGSLSESTITNLHKDVNNAYPAIYIHPSSTGARNVQVANIYNSGEDILIAGVLNGVANAYAGTREIITPSGVSRRQLVLRGTSGTANINIDGTDYLATFSTNLSATGTAFVSTHGATILSNEGVTVTGNNILTFEHDTAGFPEITITNLTGDLAGNFGDVFEVTTTSSEYVDANGVGVKYPAGNNYTPTDETLIQKKDVVTLINAEAIKNKVLVADTVDGVDVTSTTSTTVTKSYLIPANSTSEGTLSIEALFHKTGTTGSVIYHLYTNTTDSLSGAVYLGGSGTVSASNRSAVLARKCYIKAGDIITVIATSTGGNNTVVAGNPPTSETFNPAVDNYILFTVTLGDATDAAKLTGAEIVFRKQ